MAAWLYQPKGANRHGRCECTGSASRTGEVEAQLQSTVAEEEITGLSAAIVYDQDTVWAKGFGYANREAQILATRYSSGKSVLRFEV